MIEPTTILRNGSEEMAHLSYGQQITENPELFAKWNPPLRKEIGGYIGSCIYPVTPEWKAIHWINPDDVTKCEWICLLQEKRDATTGPLEKLKARLAIDGSVEIRKDLHPDPSKNYCNTLKPESF